RLKRDSGAESVRLVQLLTHIVPQWCSCANTDYIPRRNQLGSSIYGTVSSILVNTVEQRLPGLIVVHCLSRAPPVTDAVGDHDRLDLWVVGSRGDDHTAAKAPTQQPDSLGVDLGGDAQPSDSRAHIFDPFLGNEATTLAFA